MTTDLTPVPPHNLDAERAVLGCCLLGDKADITKAATILRPDDFYARANRLIFDAILDLHLKGGGIDPLLIKIELERRDHLKELGGRVLNEETHDVETGEQYLASLVLTVDSAVNVIDYCRIVREVAQKREAVRAAIEIELAGRNGHTGPEVTALMRGHVERLHSMFASIDTVDPFETIRMTESDTTPWLLRGYIARRAVTLLTALPKAGKSTIAYAIAAALQRGDSTFCDLAIPEPVDVLVMSEEDDDVLAETFKAVHLNPDRVPVFSRRRAFPRRPLSQDIDFALARIKKQPRIGLVIIDTWRFWANLPDKGGNDADTVNRAFQEIARLAASGVAVLILHHSRKSDGEDGTAASGSNALTGSADILMELRRFGKGEESSMRSIKAYGRFQRIPDETIVDYRDGTYAACGDASDAREKSAENRIASCLLNCARWLSRDELADAVGMKAATFTKAVASLVFRKAIQRVGNGKSQPFLFAANNVPLHHRPTDGEAGAVVTP